MGKIKFKQKAIVYFSVLVRTQPQCASVLTPGCPSVLGLAHPRLPLLTETRSAALYLTPQWVRNARPICRAREMNEIIRREKHWMSSVERWVGSGGAGGREVSSSFAPEPLPCFHKCWLLSLNTLCECYWTVLWSMNYEARRQTIWIDINWNRNVKDFLQNHGNYFIQLGSNGVRYVYVISNLSDSQPGLQTGLVMLTANWWKMRRDSSEDRCAVSR